ncbi:nuclear pore complex protein Nup214 [Aplochiton taeniatus]
MSDDPDSPPEREMKDFQFRQMKKTRVFASPDDLPKERSSLLALSNKFGLTFVGQDRMLKVYFTRDVLAADKVDGNSNEIVEGTAAFVEVFVELPLHNLALSSDELTLSACGMSLESGLLLAFFDVRAFLNQARPQKLPFATFRPGCGRGTCVQDMKWNPGQASMLAACLSDGSLMVLDVTDRVTVQAQLPASHGITCICWSPKGKQVAAGKMNATVSQYTPALQEKKVIPCPSFYSADNPVKVLDVLWLSTFVFAVAYAASDGSPETPPELVVISLPKKDEKRGEIYLNFNDLVYGTCTERQHHYLLNHIEDWDVVFAASAASIEVSVIAKQEDKTNWELWILEDASRAELPVSQSSDDTLPMGMAIDYTSQQDIYISDEKSLPPAPTLLLLSTDGVLCPFSLLNLNPGAKQLMAAPIALSLDGERLPPAGLEEQLHTSLTVPLDSDVPAAPAPLASFPPLQPAATATPPPLAAASFPTPPLAPVSSSSFSFALPPSYTTSASSPAPSAFSMGGPPRLASPSPITVLRGTPEPATPAVKLNLNDRFLAVDTPAPAATISQPFSFAPKPVVSDPGITSTPPPAVTRPPGMPVRPVQTSTPPTMVQRPPPATQSSAPTPQPPHGLMKTLEKQQKKDSDPVMAGILEEISHFEKELDDLKARSQRADFKVGTNEEMRSLRKESEELHIFTLEIKETTESLHGDISCLKTTMLEGFAGAEDARAQSELNRDRGYLQLLYKKPLDPRSEERLKEIRRLYQYVKFASEDVNDILDVEWEKHLEMKKKQRHMVVPGRESLFTTLANNLEIINQQKSRLDRLTKELHALRLYNKTSSWSTPPPQPSPSAPAQSLPTTAAGLDQELESLRDALLRATLETAPKTPSKSPAKMSPVKQSQLRNFLSKRQTPPVRSTAPANLSRSAFLSPKYYEDLDDVSSTSSLSQSLDPNPALLELEEEEDLVPLPLPMMSHQAPASMLPRHPTVVRTPSIAIQSGFGAIGQSTPFSKVHHPGLGGLGLGISPIASPVPINKINMGGADSTALATKTVKHGAPPNEKALPFTLPAQQAAASAALRRQMANQKPAGSLTESTLKTVPQVVNVQELKDSKGPPVPVSTVISSSVPAPAAQVVQQVLATVATNQAKRNPTQSLLKAAAERAASPQTGFVFGCVAGGAPKAADGPSASGASLGEQSSKGFSFSAASSSAFSFSSVSQGAAGSQVKDGAKFSFSSAAASGGGGVGKMLFGSTGSEEPFSFTPKSASASPALGAGSPTPPPTVSGEPVRPSSSTGALRVEPHPARGGETLGSFSGLRVGQGDEEAKDAPAKPAASGFMFGQPDSGGGGLGTGAAQFSFGSDLPKAADSGAAELSKPAMSMSSGGVFKPPEPSAKTAFSSFNSLLIESPEEPKAPSPPIEPSLLSEPEPSPEPPTERDSPHVDSTTTAEDQAPSPVVAQKTPTPPPIAPSPAPTQEVPPASFTAPAEDAEAAPAQPPAATTPVPTPETAPDPGAVPESAPAPPPPEASAQPPPPPYQAPASDKPGSIFTQGTATSDSFTVGITPVIVAAAPASATTTTTTTPASSSTPSAVFCQPTAAQTTEPAPAPALAPAPAASPAPTPTPPPVPASAPTGFGSTGFGASSTGGFGQPAFGQPGGFGQPAANTGFGFGQAAFGASPGFGPPAGGAAPAVSSSNSTTTGTGLFGAPTASNASSFSFGSGASTASSPGTGLFGQSTTPAFGQQSSAAFGQGSVFGGNTTTTSSTGFSFGQPATFGSSSGTSVFGQPQQPSSGGVFGQQQQQQPSSGGGLFGSGSGHTGGSSTGGGFFSGLGGKPSEDAANKNPFGAAPSTGGFGQPSQTGAPSLFGSSGAKGFGFGQQAAFGEQKPSGTFSTGAGSVAAQGFGSFSTPAKPTGGFGSAPVFGSPPAFGGQPAFGGAAAFGAAPSFTSPMGSSAGKVFGEGTTASSMGGFGFASPQNAPSFGSIASQGAQAPSFGSLAQQSPGFGGQTSTFGQPGGFGQPQGGGFPGGGFGSTNQLTPRWP